MTGQLSALARKSRVGTGAFTWQSYHFAYDPFGNMTQISVSGADNTATSTPSSAIMLAKYQYESGVNNGRLQKMTFGNDQTVQYSYDKFDRTTKEQYNNVTYEYAYDASGQLAKQTSTAGEEYNYEYDSLGRLIRSNEYNDGEFEQRTEHIYDASNRLTKQSWYNAGGTTTMSYAYSTTTGLLSSLNATVQNSSIPVAYTYQGANQLRSKAIGSVMTKAYNFGTSSGYRTALPNYVNYRDSSGNLIYGDNCHYDSNGRLVKILDSGSSTTTRATYGYDQQGQLTSATVGGTSYTYTYDTAGNIQSKKVGSTTTNYTYGNSAWRDLLTAYNGGSITYSGGNPTKYYDGSTFTWTQGRRLATAKVDGTNISYTYDMAGVRSSKTVGSTKYDFTTLSGLVTRQTGGGKTIDFVYDENNQPLAMKYNNTLYYYVLNAQGDVVRIVNSSRSVVASYTYDPWGKIISSSGTLADINPLRYRGYYYDSETGFYYLQSRYYDPEIGRFINADSYASTDIVGLLSTNMFSYCENNPVNRSDPSGHAGYGLMSGWDPIKFHNRKKPKSNFEDIVTNAIKYSTEVSAGFGMGLSATIETLDCGFSAGYSYNVFEAYYEDGQLGARVAERAGASIKTPLYNIGIEKSTYRDLAMNIIASPDDWQGYCKYLPDTLVDISLYVGYGGSVRVGINWEKFAGYVIEHGEKINK